MEKNREGWLVSKTHRECTKCGVIFEITSRMTLCKACNSTRVRSQTPEWKMHQRAKARCKESGREFDLQVEDIIIPAVCPILGFPLVSSYGKPGAAKDSPSLDRIDSGRGYTKDNIQVVSHQANLMKHCASIAELQKFAQWVLSTFPVEPNALD